jgi:hypothetical protein
MCLIGGAGGKGGEGVDAGGGGMAGTVTIDELEGTPPSAVPDDGLADSGIPDLK